MVAFLCPAPFIKTGFRANAVHFDGTNDYMLRGAGLTGASDAYTGIFHCWFKTSNTTEQNIFRSASDGLYVGMNGSNKLIVRLTLVSTSIFQFVSTNSFADGVWHSLLVYWNSNAAAGAKTLNVYIDDAAVGGTRTDAVAASQVDYTYTDWAVGARPITSEKYNGDLSQLYFAPGQYLDFSVEANRRLFITAANKPVSLGSSGSSPTGSQPIIFLDNPAASFQTNKGSGGNFSVTGALTAASTSPSD